MTDICKTLAPVLSLFVNSYFNFTLKWRQNVPSKVCTNTQLFSISVHSAIENMMTNASHALVNVEAWHLGTVTSLKTCLDHKSNKTQTYSRS
jgi:hypothetical protein